MFLSADTKRVQVKQHMDIYTHSYIRAQQISNALKVCDYEFVQIHPERFFQWEFGKFQVRYRVSFLADMDLTYADVEKTIVECMKRL